MRYRDDRDLATSLLTIIFFFGKLLIIFMVLFFLFSKINAQTSEIEKIYTEVKQIKEAIK